MYVTIINGLIYISHFTNKKKEKYRFVFTDFSNFESRNYFSILLNLKKKVTEKKKIKNSKKKIKNSKKNVYLFS